MAKTYRIHPAIGIGRVGNSEKFYLAPELPEGTAIDIDISAQLEMPLKAYKDETGKIKKQAVRFRIWEHEETDNGLTSIREITSNEATIEWRVRLGNKKAAHETVSPQNSGNRNQSISDQSKLELTSNFPPISGASQSTSEINTPKFLGSKDVSLGLLKTDAMGRLIVIGGNGNSERVPGNETDRLDYADNDLWFDDTSDGYVEATIKLNNEEELHELKPSWVIFSPPDYAPEIRAIFTLYDVAKGVAYDEYIVSIPDEISFQRDVMPIFERARTLGNVVPESYKGTYDLISNDMAKLSNNSDENSQFRQESLNNLKLAFDTIERLEQALSDYFDDVLKLWVAGNFKDDFSIPTTAGTNITPSGLDRAALDQTVGGGFFPGIEAGKWMSKREEIYAFELVDGELSPRLNSENLSVFYGGRTISGPGYMTAGMALPWQADFLKCKGNSSFLWWPAQRPDSALMDADNPQSRVPWIKDDVLTTHKALIETSHRLAFIREVTNLAGDKVFVEDERDPTLPRNLVS